MTTPSLRSTVNLANPDAYDDPGPRPTARTTSPLQRADGKALRGRDLRSLKFTGATTLPPLPLAWTVVNNDPDRAGQPGAVVGQRQQHRRRGGHLGDACRPPTRR